MKPDQVAKDIFWTFATFGGATVVGGLLIALHIWQGGDAQRGTDIARLSSIGGGLIFAVGMATKIMFETLARL